MTKFKLRETPVHLGLGATTVVLPPFDGTMAWYERYGAAHDKDGVEGRLVSLHHFERDWSTWEVHPVGSEMLVVISGRMTLVQRLAGKDVSIELEAGEAAINPPGVWHTGRTKEGASVLFITAGLGTENRETPPETA